MPSAAGSVPASTGRLVVRGASPMPGELANLPLFRDLDPARLHALIRRARVVTLGAGERLFRQGDPAAGLFVIVDGAVVPIAEGERRRKLAVLERGDFLGEIGLITGHPRNATVEAIVDSVLIEIDRRTFRSLLDVAPEVAEIFLRQLRTRLVDRQVRTGLLFAAFAPAERRALARQLRLLEVGPGTKVVQRGRPPEGLFIVLAGTLRVASARRSEGGRERTIGRLGPGDVFGGRPLIEGRPSEVDVVASAPVWLAVLGEGRFRRILASRPVLDRVLRRLESPRRAQHARVAPLVV